MIANSQARISKRRQGALVRRQADVVKHRSSFISDANSDHNKALLAKIAIAETDIANLQKKGIR